MAYPGYLNVKSDFGAVGNGTADDTNALRKAMAEAVRLGGATVYLPCGVYRTAGIEVTGTFSLIGDGERSVLFSSDLSRSVLKVNEASGALFSGFTIRSAATGDYSRRNPLLNGLFLYKSDNCTVDRVTAERTFAAGMLLSYCTGCRVTGCTVRNTLADGIHLTGKCKDCTVERNRTFETGDDGIAVVSYLGDGDLCERIVIQSNSVERSWSRGIVHVGGRGVTIADNFVRSSASSGILVVEDTNYRTYKPYDTIIRHNQISQAGTYSPARPVTGNRFGIEIASGAVGILADGNTVKESQNAGMAVTAPGPGVTIRGNYLFRNRDSGVRIEGTQHLQFSGNTMEDNRRYGLTASRVVYGIFEGNHWVNNNFFDMDSPGSGTPTPDIRAVDNANFSDCSDCTITGNVSVDSRKDRPAARAERAFEIVRGTRIKAGGNVSYLYNADPAKAVTGESFLPGSAECEVLDAFTGFQAPSWKTFRAGQTYFRKDTREWFLYDGQAWRKVSLS